MSITRKRKTTLFCESLEDRAVPAVVTIVPMMNGSEGSSGGYTIYRDGDTSSSLSVNLSYSGTASSGDHSGGSSATIPAYSSSTYHSVSFTDDSTAELTETLICSITSGSYTIGENSSATINISDNETP
jgi:hypothetical protein